jgi:hypothetical protein
MTKTTRRTLTNALLLTGMLALLFVSPWAALPLYGAALGVYLA